MYTPVDHLVHARVALPSQLVGAVTKPQSAEGLLAAKLPFMQTSSQASCPCKQDPHSYTAMTEVTISQGSMQTFLRAMTVSAASHRAACKALWCTMGMHAGGMRWYSASL